MPKGKRTYNARLLKATYAYTVQEISDLFGLHKNVVRRWLKQGLKAIDSRKPFLIRGDELARFLNERQVARKVKCQPNEFYCVRCRAPRQAYGNMVDVQQEGNHLVRVKGICTVCSTPVNKSQALANMPTLIKIFDIQQRTGFDLLHYTQPRLKVDMEDENANT